MVTENDLNKLRDLQEILSRKIKLEQAILEIPKFLVNLEEAYNRTRKAFIEKNLDRERMRREEEEVRSSLKDAEADREKAEKSISEISTQREYEALDKERHHAEEREQQYGRDVQQKERAIAELNEQIKQYESLIAQQEGDLAERRSAIEAEKTEKNSQIEALQREERELTGGLDKEVVFKFERILRNKSGIGIVAIKGNVCMGCHMILPAQFSNNVRIGAEFVFCPYCSRILFYEETTDGEEVFFDAGDTGALYDPEEEEEEFDDDEAEAEKVGGDFEE